MDSILICFSNPVTRQIVEKWALRREFVFDEELGIHMGERFGVKSVEVVSAVIQGEDLLLQLTTDLWLEPREFALLSSGSLVW
jgi:hypothetical protein